MIMADFNWVFLQDFVAARHVIPLPALALSRYFHPQSLSEIVAVEVKDAIASRANVFAVVMD